MENDIREPLWTKSFVIVSFINFLVTLMFYLLMVIIAGYAVDKFGASTSSAGLVASIFIIGTLFGRLVTGRFIISWGNRKTLMIGLGCLTITTLAYFVTATLPLLIINRLLHGIASGIIGTATGTIIAQIIPPTRRGEGIGYFSLSNILATAIGPFIGILLTGTGNSFTTIFIVNTILVSFCIGTFFFLNLQNEPRSQQTAKPTKKGFIMSDYIEPKALPVSLIALLIGFAYSGVMSFLSFYSKDINLVHAGSLFFLIYSIAVIFSRPFSGTLLDRRGANIVMYPALTFFAIGMALFSQATTSMIFLMAACLMGLGYGNFLSIAQAMAVKVTEPHRFGLATSTFYIFLDLGLGVGPYLLGYLVPVFGYREVFLSMVPVIITSLVLYGVLLGRKQISIKQRAVRKVEIP